MPVKDLCHEAIGRPSHRGDLLKHGRTILLVGLERFLERGNLAFQAANTRQQFVFISIDVRHAHCIAYWGTVYGAFMTDLSARLRHIHNFNDGNPLGERNTRRAVWLTSVMMVAEIVGGYAYNSMALLADGWHMSSHALALGLSAIAFVYARRLSADSRFAFGTWKIEVLGGYTSAILLLLVAGLMFVQSVQRLFAPVTIHYPEAIAVACIGLAVNLICAWWLRDHHDHSHGDHHHGHSHGHAHGQDLNLRAAYLHVLADAATSVLAIVALIGGMLWGANWLDPLMGIAGAVLVTVWAIGLLRESGRALLDAEMNAPVTEEIREVIKTSATSAEITDLHVWRVAKGKYACIVSLATDEDKTPDYFREQLAIHEELVHITVEVNPIAVGV